MLSWKFSTILKRVLSTLTLGTTAFLLTGISNADAAVENWTNASGTDWFTGTNSALTAQGNFFIIGVAGTGSLSIQNGGVVNAVNSILLKPAT